MAHNIKGCDKVHEASICDLSSGEQNVCAQKSYVCGMSFKKFFDGLKNPMYKYVIESIDGTRLIFEPQNEDGSSKGVERGHEIDVVYDECGPVTNLQNVDKESAFMLCAKCAVGREY